MTAPLRLPPSGPNRNAASTGTDDPFARVGDLQRPPETATDPFTEIGDMGTGTVAARRMFDHLPETERRVHLDRMLRAQAADDRGPSLGQQVAAGAKSAYEGARHPVQTLKGMAMSALEDLGTVGSAMNAGMGQPSDLTPERAATVPRAMLNTAANALLPAAPASGFLMRTGINATLGAVNDAEQPLRGATAAAMLGEAVHQAPKVIPSRVRPPANLMETASDGTRNASFWRNLDDGATAQTVRGAEPLDGYESTSQPPRIIKPNPRNPQGFEPGANPFDELASTLGKQKPLAVERPTDIPAQETATNAAALDKVKFDRELAAAVTPDEGLLQGIRDDVRQEELTRQAALRALTGVRRRPGGVKPVEFDLSSLEEPGLPREALNPPALREKALPALDADRPAPEVAPPAPADAPLVKELPPDATHEQVTAHYADAQRVSDALPVGTVVEDAQGVRYTKRIASINGKEVHGWDDGNGPMVENAYPVIGGRISARAPAPGEPIPARSAPSPLPDEVAASSAPAPAEPVLDAPPSLEAAASPDPTPADLTTTAAPRSIKPLLPDWNATLGEPASLARERERLLLDAPLTETTPPEALQNRLEVFDRLAATDPVVADRARAVAAETRAHLSARGVEPIPSYPEGFAMGDMEGRIPKVPRPRGPRTVVEDVAPAEPTPAVAGAAPAISPTETLLAGSLPEGVPKPGRLLNPNGFAEELRPGLADADAALAAKGVTKRRVSLDEQRQQAAPFRQQLAADLGMSVLDLDRRKLASLTGAEIVAVKEQAGQFMDQIAALTKQLADPAISDADRAAVTSHLDNAKAMRDGLLERVITASSQKGRDLAFMRQLAQRTLDPDVWMLQAKKALGDRPMSDAVVANLTRLVNEAATACGGGA